jgi:hypothetical protein
MTYSKQKSDWSFLVQYIRAYNMIDQWIRTPMSGNLRLEQVDFNKGSPISPGRSRYILIHTIGLAEQIMGKTIGSCDGDAPIESVVDVGSSIQWPAGEVGLTLAVDPKYDWV